DSVRRSAELQKGSHMTARAAQLAALFGLTLSALALLGANVSGDGDKKFVTKAAQGGAAEVKMGRLAAENAQSEDVKTFGKKMVEDHTKAARNWPSWPRRTASIFPPANSVIIRSIKTGSPRRRVLKST